MTPNKVKAQTYWVWTNKAQEENPQRSRTGDPIWPHYLYEAPEDWLERGLICDSTAKEVMKEGQVDMFDYPGVI